MSSASCVAVVRMRVLKRNDTLIYNMCRIHSACRKAIAYLNKVNKNKKNTEQEHRKNGVQANCNMMAHARFYFEI